MAAKAPAKTGLSGMPSRVRTTAETVRHVEPSAGHLMGLSGEASWLDACAGIIGQCATLGVARGLAVAPSVGCVLGASAECRIVSRVARTQQARVAPNPRRHSRRFCDFWIFINFRIFIVINFLSRLTDVVSGSRGARGTSRTPEGRLGASGGRRHALGGSRRRRICPSLTP